MMAAKNGGDAEKKKHPYPCLILQVPKTLLGHLTHEEERFMQHQLAGMKLHGERDRWHLTERDLAEGIALFKAGHSRREVAAVRRLTQALIRATKHYPNGIYVEMQL
jgi:hypothetical protein